MLHALPAAVRDRMARTAPAPLALWREAYRMMISLKGHAALVTGSTQGIGRAIALAFAEAGRMSSFMAATNATKAHAVAEACRRLGVRSEFVAANLLDDPESSPAEIACARAGDDGIHRCAGKQRGAVFRCPIRADDGRAI